MTAKPTAPLDQRGEKPKVVSVHCGDHRPVFAMPIAQRETRFLVTTRPIEQRGA